MHVSRLPSLLLACTVAVLGFSQPVAAQTIHGHPQKAAYGSPAEYPLISAQGHWGDDNNAMGMFMLAHTHVECWAPIYAETTGPLTLRCRLQLFHLDGGVGMVYGDLISNIVWETPGPLTGDPTGVVVRNFTATFDPALSQRDLESPFRNVPDRGWWLARIGARTFFTNGTVTNTELMVPFFSMINPSAPIPAWDGGEASTFMAGGVRASIDGNSPRSVTNGYGLHVSEYHDFLPILAPISTRQSITGFTYAYGVIAGLPQPGTWNQFNDPDLHHGITGTLVKQVFATGGATDTVVIDPAALGTGAHQIALDWDQQTGAGNALFHANEQMTSRLVVTVTVGDGVTPTPTPDPTPTPTWAAFAPTFQRLDNSVRLCAPDGACVVLGTVSK